MAIVAVCSTHGGDESARFVFFTEEARDAFLEGNGLGERSVGDRTGVSSKY